MKRMMIMLLAVVMIIRNRNKPEYLDVWAMKQTDGTPEASGEEEITAE